MFGEVLNTMSIPRVLEPASLKRTIFGPLPSTIIFGLAPEKVLVAVMVCVPALKIKSPVTSGNVYVLFVVKL